MSIAVQNRVAHLEQMMKEAMKVKKPEDVDQLLGLTARVEKLEGEIRAMKARMGKAKEDIT